MCAVDAAFFIFGYSGIMNMMRLCKHDFMVAPFRMNALMFAIRIFDFSWLLAQHFFSYFAFAGNDDIKNSSYRILNVYWCYFQPLTEISRPFI